MIDNSNKSRKIKTLLLNNHSMDQHKISLKIITIKIYHIYIKEQVDSLILIYIKIYLKNYLIIYHIKYYYLNLLVYIKINILTLILI